MKLTTVAHPFSGSEWCFEVKYDGFRTLTEFGPAGVRIHSRRGIDMTRCFPEVELVLGSIRGKRCIIDGEIAVLNAEGVAGDPEFRRLLRRRGRQGYRPGDDPVTLLAFDLLVLRDRNVMDLPLLERKAQLTRLLAGLPQVQVVPHFLADGVSLYAAAARLGVEGIVAKRVSSIYQPGVRSPDWRKVPRPGAVPAQRFRPRGDA